VTRVSPGQRRRAIGRRSRVNAISRSRAPRSVQRKRERSTLSCRGLTRTLSQWERGCFSGIRTRHEFISISVRLVGAALHP
jgi:hypothetical protein